MVLEEEEGSSEDGAAGHKGDCAEGKEEGYLVPTHGSYFLDQVEEDLLTLFLLFWFLLVCTVL